MCFARSSNQTIAFGLRASGSGIFLGPYEMMFPSNPVKKLFTVLSNMYIR